jgi:hypothetical protein
MNPDRIRIIKLHKRWADGWMLLWQIFALLLFGGIYIGLEQFDVGAAERSAAFILLGVMVLVAAIWQSTGLGVARVQLRGFICCSAELIWSSRLRNVSQTWMAPENDD